jgi:hypothetical protein
MLVETEKVNYRCRRTQRIFARVLYACRGKTRRNAVGEDTFTIAVNADGGPFSYGKLLEKANASACFKQSPAPGICIVAHVELH